MSSNRKRAFNPYAEPWRGQGDTRPGQALTLYRRHDTPTLPILHAVNALWREIQHNNPGTPNVNIVLQASERTHGHFAPGSWQTSSGETMHELMLSTVSLGMATNEGRIVKTVSTLLHEAAHAYAHANGIKDTSRQGRWHNKNFATLAERFGCEVSQNPQIGHVTDGITPTAYALYRDHIRALSEAVTVYRRSAGFDLAGLFGGLGGAVNPFGPMPRRPRKAYGSQTLNVTCSHCEAVPYRIPRALFESSTITCHACGSEYVES
jgi:hypothetical protein